jgi:hypothetical protein
MLAAWARPLRVPGDGEPLDGGELHDLVTLSRAWSDKAGTRALAAREQHAELQARRAARRT